MIVYAFVVVFIFLLFFFFLFTLCLSCFFFFFFNDTATTEIYTLSLHDALPIWVSGFLGFKLVGSPHRRCHGRRGYADRKSTRLNSSHLVISYAVFCLKKKKKKLRELCHPNDQTPFSATCREHKACYFLTKLVVT